ncbi:MAG: plasmid pRiA4b ORF-3 family protein [Candidatus Uhrbacteria bacterium]
MQKENLFQLKIQLVGVEPVVWRELVISSISTFFDLHVAIQDTFGWTDSHLHQFVLDNPFSCRKKLRFISLPVLELDPEDAPGDERKIFLSKQLIKPKDKIWYEYDLGDSWMHEVTLQKILPQETFKKTPVLLDGANATPPEDCGGMCGYANLLEILANPKNPDHKDMLEWLGIKKASEFNPKKFDKTRVRFRDSKKYLKMFLNRF